MKKILISLFILLPIIACGAPVKIDGIYYNLISKAKQAEVVSNPNENVTNPSSLYSGDIVIPEKVIYEGNEYIVTKISDRAFGASSLKSVSIPKTIKIIGQEAFKSCKSVYITDLVAWFNMEFSSIPFVNDYRLFLNKKEIKELDIPESITIISSFKFKNCISLSSVNMHSGISSIEHMAFHNCKNIENINLPDGLSIIGWYSFAGCSKLKSIVIPNSVTSDLYYAFESCSSLTDVIIGDGVTIINEHAFDNCSSLKSLKIGKNVTVLGSGSFMGCINLNEIEIPDNVNAIGNWAFYGCSNLITVSLGKKVRIISWRAFAYCTELKEIFCYSEIVPGLDDEAFMDSYPEYITLYVIDDLVSIYKKTTPWNRFGEIIGLKEAAGISSTIIDTQEPRIYDIQGNRLENLRKGVNIILTKEGKVKKVLKK